MYLLTGSKKKNPIHLSSQVKRVILKIRSHYLYFIFLKEEKSWFDAQSRKFFKRTF